MGIEDVEFLRMEGFKGMGMVAHGFGMRGKAGERLSKKDWRGQNIRMGEEVFPLISTRQMHGDGVVVFKGRPQKPEELWSREGDALITHVQGYALGVFTADCLPLLLFDPVQRAVGIVHIGWRGTEKAVTQKAVRKMREAFHCMSENILAALGPCIGPCCLEVDDPVKDTFVKGALPWELMSYPRGKGKWSLDLHRANIYLLAGAGVRRENIHRLDLCTSCRRDIFYSHRGEGGTGGRQINFIALRKGEKGHQKIS